MAGTSGPPCPPRPGPMGKDWWLKHVAPGQAWHINSRSPHAPQPTALVGLPNEAVFPGPFDLAFNDQSLLRSPAMPPQAPGPHRAGCLDSPPHHSG